jgi:methyltransferase (TIGR00027 family)
VDARTPSRTALGVAAHRAVHERFDASPKILGDPIAASLLGESSRAALAERPAWMDGLAARRLRSRVVVRSRFAEDRLQAAVARGVRQCIMLGAGFDTFAWRQPAWAADLQIFEVDHPATQGEKRARLAAAGHSAPANLAFAPIDFETTSLVDGLRASSLDFTRPAFFSCLGVLVYLTAEAADAVFRLAARFPATSELVFSFSQRNDSLLADRAATAGEPWLTSMTPRDLTRRLAELGYAEIDFLTPAETRRRYFPHTRSDGLRAPTRTFLAAAVVGDNRR